MLIEAINIIAPLAFWAIRSKITYVCTTIDNITKIIFCTISWTTYINRLSDRITLFI